MTVKIMFGLFKSDQEKVQERFRKNLEIYNSRAKKFYINPNYPDLWEYIIESTRFLYSIHQLKKYPNHSLPNNISLKVDTMLFIAAVIEQVLKFEKDLNIFKPEVLFYKIFQVENAASDFREYHYFCVSNHLRGHIYSNLKHYMLDDINKAHNFYLQRVKKHNNANNFFLDSKSEEFIDEFVTFFRNQSERINQSFETSTHRLHNYRRWTLPYKYYWYENIPHYSPRFFRTYIVQELDKKIDNYLLKRLNIDIDEINLDSDQPSLSSNVTKISHFRMKVAQATSKWEDEYNNSVLHLQKGKKQLKGVEIEAHLKDFIFFNSFAENTSYQF